MAELEKRDGKVGLREMLSTHDVTGGRVLYDSSRNRTIILDPEDKENNKKWRRSSWTSTSPLRSE